METPNPPHTNPTETTLPSDPPTPPHNIPTWQIPENSNLKWVWIEGDGPFLTNATLGQEDPQPTPPSKPHTHTFNVMVCLVNLDSPNNENLQHNAMHDSFTIGSTPDNQVTNLSTSPINTTGSLLQRLNMADFRFETGEPSQPTLFCQETVELNPTETQTQIQPFQPPQVDQIPSDWQTPLGLTHTSSASLLNLVLLSQDQTQQPYCPGPPTNLVSTISPPLLDEPDPHTTDPNPTLGPYNELIDPNQNLIFTLDSYSTSSPPDSPSHDTSPPSDNPLFCSHPNHSPTNKKRIRKDLGKFGRNLRQRLFCGLFKCECFEAQENWEDDPIMAVEDQLAQLESTSGKDHTSALSNANHSQGFWEADPNQLPKDQ